jgi:hypothetical protein
MGLAARFLKVGEIAVLPEKNCAVAPKAKCRNFGLTAAPRSGPGRDSGTPHDGGNLGLAAADSCAQS